MQQLLADLQNPRPESLMTREVPGLMNARGDDITALGGRGIDLLVRLSNLASGLKCPQLAREIEALTLPLAGWIARCDAEIVKLDPVVNGAAALANRLKEPRKLAQLYRLLTEIGSAVSPQVSQENLSVDSARPWRVFLLNKAIVATRSHEPELMEEAFDSLADQLPDDAPGFFREGMEQMDAPDYPHEVRAVMERWYEQWCGPRVLH
jgi:hypothetical protein